MSHTQHLAELDCHMSIHGLNHHIHHQTNNNNNNNNGWPFGLYSFIDHAISGYHHHHHQNQNQNQNQNYGHSHSHIGLACPPSHMGRSLSTPSTTSQSCSSDDFETQSSGSFFPDQSTTLGSLIGLRSRSQTQGVEKTRKTSGMSNLGEGTTMTTTAILRRDRTCCSLLMCGSGDRHKEIGVSPSLAHLLDKEKKTMLPSLIHFLERRNKVRPWIRHKRGTLVVEQEGFYERHRMVHAGSSLFGKGMVLPPPRPTSGTPLKLFLERSSPNSSIISTDWDAFIGRGEAMSQHQDGPQQASLSHGIWSSLCFKDSRRLAN